MPPRYPARVMAALMPATPWAPEIAALMRLTRCLQREAVDLVPSAPAAEQLERQPGKSWQATRCRPASRRHGPEEEVGRACQDLERRALKWQEALDPLERCPSGPRCSDELQAPYQIRAQGDAAKSGAL